MDDASVPLHGSELLSTGAGSVNLVMLRAFGDQALAALGAVESMNFCRLLVAERVGFTNQ